MTARLLDALAEVIAMLDEHDHVFWLQQLITSRNAIARGESKGYERLLGLYGDGCSLNALTLPTPSEQPHFDSLIKECYRLASSEHHPTSQG